MSNNDDNDMRKRDHDDDNDPVGVVDDVDDDDDDDDSDMDEYNLETATEDLFEIIDSDDDVSPRDERLAIDLLERFPNAAQTFSASYGELLLHVACANDAPEALIRALLKAWPEAVSTKTIPGSENQDDDDMVGLIPLHEACLHSRSLKTFQLLIEAWPMSIQERYQSQNGGTSVPIYMYLHNNAVSLDIVQYLVEQWLELIKIPFGSKLALHWACEKGLSAPIIQYLADQWPRAARRQVRQGLPLHIACSTPGTPIDTITCLINMWPESLQVYNDDGYLPLHVACGKDAPNADVSASEALLIQVLLTAWPDGVSKRTLVFDGWRDYVEGMGPLPLHLACSHAQSLKTIQILLEAWPMSIQEHYLDDDNGRFLPLHSHLANETKSLESVQYLVEQWPESIKFPIFEDLVALHWACSKSSVSPTIFQYLVDQWPEAV